MKMILGTARGLVRRAAVMAVAAVAVTAISHGRAEALSLASPVALPSAKHASEAMTIEVRGGHHGGGGFRAAHVYRGGGFRAAPIYRGGGYQRFGGYGVRRYAYQRPYFHRRHFHHRRYFAPAYYGYPRYYHRYCRIVWTYWGPRRICRPPYWHRHHYWGVRYW